MDCLFNKPQDKGRSPKQPLGQLRTGDGRLELVEVRNIHNFNNGIELMITSTESRLHACFHPRHPERYGSCALEYEQARHEYPCSTHTC